MPNYGKVPVKEHSKHHEGRSGQPGPAGMTPHNGPAIGGNKGGNPTKSGGINRTTQGQGKK